MKKVNVARSVRSSIAMMLADSFFFFRVTVCALATLIGIFAVWIIAGELVSPRLIYFPSNPNEAKALYAVRDTAATAAVVGIVRGDLWTVAAITRAAPLLFEASGKPSEEAAPTEVENTRIIADHAARLSPHDSRIWLVLASLDSRLDGSNHKMLETLKLSYYTGPNELSLMPLRILLAVQSNAISDEELQSLVSLEIQRIIMQRPDLKPAIALAYKNSLPKGRDIIEAALKQADPNFLATISVPSRPH